MSCSLSSRPIDSISDSIDWQAQHRERKVAAEKLYAALVGSDPVAQEALKKRMQREQGSLFLRAKDVERAFVPKARLIMCKTLREQFALLRDATIHALDECESRGLLERVKIPCTCGVRYFYCERDFNTRRYRVLDTSPIARQPM